jgi:hypothetical protein
MEARLFEGFSLKERQEVLHANASAIEKKTYSRPLDQAEIAKMQTEFAQKAIDLDIAETALKAERENFKLKAKPIKKEMAVLMQGIRSGSEEVTEEVYLMADMSEKMMGYYNKEGVLISSRPLMQNEMQYSINESLKKVN